MLGAPGGARAANRRDRGVPSQTAEGSKMRQQNLFVNAGVFATIMLLAGLVSAQTQNPRFGKWKYKSDAPPPTSNIMTYEPIGAKGMKVTIDAVDKNGEKSQWFYTTMFDGKDEPVTGNPGSDTAAVRIINDKINEIVYKKGGRVTQVLTNVLSPDESTIAVVYMRTDATGKTGVSFATYERQK
jgi:hypothetical protein